MLISVSIKLFAQLPWNTFWLATRPIHGPSWKFLFSATPRHWAAASPPTVRPLFRPLFRPPNDPRRSHNSFEKIASQYLCVGFFISWIFALLLFIPLGHTKRCGKCRAFFIIYHSGCPRFSPNPLPIDVVPLKRSNMRKYLGNNIEQLWLRKTERGKVLNYVVFAAFVRKIFNIYLITTWTKARAPPKKKTLRIIFAAERNANNSNKLLNEIFHVPQETDRASLYNYYWIVWGKFQLWKPNSSIMVGAKLLFILLNDFHSAAAPFRRWST